MVQVEVVSWFRILVTVLAHRSALSTSTPYWIIIVRPNSQPQDYLRGARANKPCDFQGGEAFAQVILRRAITIAILIILGDSARKDYATRDYAPDT